MKYTQIEFVRFGVGKFVPISLQSIAPQPLWSFIHTGMYTIGAVVIQRELTPEDEKKLDECIERKDVLSVVYDTQDVEEDDE